MLKSSGADIKDWWAPPKDNSLSGGQIAGIVVSTILSLSRSALTDRSEVSQVLRLSVDLSGTLYDEETDPLGVPDSDRKIQSVLRDIVYSRMYRCTKSAPKCWSRRNAEALILLHLTFDT
jgi:hypothetical protein